MGFGTSSWSTFACDGRNRLLSTSDPLGKIERYTYDGNDNLLTRITPKNETISFAYDAVNQLLRKTLPDSQVTSYLRGPSAHPMLTTRALLCTVPPSVMG